MRKDYDMENRGPAARLFRGAAVLAVRGLIVVTLSSVVLMARLFPQVSASE